MNITVILRTCDRCQSLVKALDNVAAQTLAEPVEWEVLVADNTSRDQTREVLGGFCHRYHGRFRSLFEPLSLGYIPYPIGCLESEIDSS